jgi:tripeptidyl-peptidase I
VPIAFISVGTDLSDIATGFVDVITFFLNQENPPHVLTTSYGGNETDFPSSLAKLSQRFLLEKFLLTSTLIKRRM